MATSRWLANASPVILLGKIDRLDLSEVLQMRSSYSG